MAKLEGMTTSQVARQLQVSEETVRVMRRSGKLPSTETPFGHVFDPSVIAQEQRRREGLLARKRQNRRGLES